MSNGGRVIVRLPVEDTNPVQRVAPLMIAIRSHDVPIPDTIGGLRFVTRVDPELVYMLKSGNGVTITVLLIVPVY